MAGMASSSSSSDGHPCLEQQSKRSRKDYWTYITNLAHFHVRQETRDHWRGCPHIVYIFYVSVKDLKTDKYEDVPRWEVMSIKQAVEDETVWCYGSYLFWIGQLIHYGIGKGHQVFRYDDPEEIIRMCKKALRKKIGSIRVPERIQELERELKVQRKEADELEDIELARAQEDGYGEEDDTSDEEDTSSEEDDGEEQQEDPNDRHDDLESKSDIESSSDTEDDEAPYHNHQALSRPTASQINTQDLLWRLREKFTDDDVEAINSVDELVHVLASSQLDGRTQPAKPPRREARHNLQAQRNMSMSNTLPRNDDPFVEDHSSRETDYLMSGALPEWESPAPKNRRRVLTNPSSVERRSACNDHLETDDEEDESMVGMTPHTNHERDIYNISPSLVSLSQQTSQLASQIPRFAPKTRLTRTRVADDLKSFVVATPAKVVSVASFCPTGSIRDVTVDRQAEPSPRAVA